MKPRCAWMFLTVSALAISTGCVSQKQLDDLMAVNRQLESQKLDLQAQIEATNSVVSALRADTSTADQIAALTTQREQLTAALADAEQRLRDLSTTSILPPEVDSALKQLAVGNAALMTYDPELGMVRFNSDLTFALGSTQVSTEAVTILGQLAGVINSQSAAAYEVRVVGHTDNLPVRNAENVRRFQDNWGLSAFRAIAVKEVLQSASVSPNRMMIAGYSEFRPIVANGPKGAQENRRVEIYLVSAAQSGTGQEMTESLPEAVAEVDVQADVVPAPAEFK